MGVGFGAGGVEHVQEDSMARRVQVPCRRFLRELGTPFYLYLARVSVPILGTGVIETPAVSGLRSNIHAVVFLTFFYLGFIRKWGSHSIE